MASHARLSAREPCREGLVVQSEYERFCSASHGPGKAQVLAIDVMLTAIAAW